MFAGYGPKRANGTDGPTGKPNGTRRKLYWAECRPNESGGGTICTDATGYGTDGSGHGANGTSYGSNGPDEPGRRYRRYEQPVGADGAAGG